MSDSLTINFDQVPSEWFVVALRQSVFFRPPLWSITLQKKGTTDKVSYGSGNTPQDALNKALETVNRHYNPEPLTPPNLDLQT